MHEHTIPFEGSYWVVKAKLLAGPYPGSLDSAGMGRRLRGLLKCGVRHVIDLTEGHEVFYYSRGIAYYDDDLARISRELGLDVKIAHFPVVDMDVPSRRIMRTILDDIDGALIRGFPAYIHCWGGLGRTGTVVGCYLARHNLALGEKALEKIIELRQNNVFADYPSPQNSLQRDMVRSWRVGE